MKLVCNVSVGNRLQPTLAVNSRRKHAKSTLALCKNPKSQDFCIILFTSQNKTGTKYNLKQNVDRVLTRFVAEGKVTIQFKVPAHDLYVQADDSVQLKGFLHLLKRALEGTVSSKELTYSSMSVTPVSTSAAPKKLVIQSRSCYPTKGFPRTLEILHINNIQRCGLDRGILQLPKLRVLDLSNNLIEFLPEEISKLPCLAELNISNNAMGKGSPKQWSWIGGNLSKTLKLLNLSSNNLKYLPNHLIKLHNLVSLHLDKNELTSLPLGIGNLRHLIVLTASNNKITVLPGSAKKWRLQTLDLSDNSFDPNHQSNPAAIFPKPLPVCSLKEYAARRVLNARLPYSLETLPQTVIQYLDEAKYCVCGNACFDIFIRHAYMLFLLTITHSLSVSSGLTCVPMDCYFCSLRCFGTANYNRQRNPVI